MPSNASNLYPIELPRLLGEAHRRGVEWARTQIEFMRAPVEEWPVRCPGAEIAAQQTAESLLMLPTFQPLLRSTCVMAADSTWDVHRRGVRHGLLEADAAQRLAG